MLSPLPSGPSGLHDDLCSVYSGGLKQSSLSGTLPKALLLHIPVLNKVCLTLPGRLPVLVPTAPVSHAPAPFPARLLSCDQRPQLQAGQFVKFSPLKFPRRLPLPGAQRHSYCVWWGGDRGPFLLFLSCPTTQTAGEEGPWASVHLPLFSKCAFQDSVAWLF